MARLRDSPDDLNALIGATADYLRLDAGWVEKDFWVVEVLRAATGQVDVRARDGSAHPVATIFKGGTSLSRIFGIIERFSEDVDLLVAFPDVPASPNAKDKVLKAIRDNVAEHLGMAGTETSVTTGVKRYIRYPYAAQFASTGITEGVLLEMGSRGGSFPYLAHDLRSMIAHHAIAEMGGQEDDWDEFIPVGVQVLAPERTLLEKLALLHDGASRYPDAKARDKLLAGGRHLYDVHRLLTFVSVTDSLRAGGPSALESMCADIDEHSANAEFSFTPRPTGGYSASPLLDPTGQFREALRQGYDTAMRLVHGQRPSFDECLDTIRASRPLV
jgi:hypothetical protein